MPETDTEKEPVDFREEVAERFEILEDRFRQSGLYGAEQNSILKSHANTLLVYAGFIALFLVAFNVCFKKINALEAVAAGIVEAASDVS